MTPLVYDIAIALGLIAVTAGAYLVWSVGVALLAAGGLVIVLTLLGALFGRAAPRR